MTKVERVMLKAEIARTAGKLAGLYARLYRMDADRWTPPPQVILGPRPVGDETRAFEEGLQEGYGEPWPRP